MRHDQGFFAFSPPDAMHSVLLGICVYAVQVVVEEVRESWEGTKGGADAALVELESRMERLPTWTSRSGATYGSFKTGSARSALSAGHRATDFEELAPLLIFGIAFDAAVIKGYDGAANKRPRRLRVQRMLLELAVFLHLLSSSTFETAADVAALGTARWRCVGSNDVASCASLSHLARVCCDVSQSSPHQQSPAVLQGRHGDACIPGASLAPPNQAQVHQVALLRVRAHRDLRPPTGPAARVRPAEDGEGPPADEEGSCTDARPRRLALPAALREYRGRPVVVARAPDRRCERHQLTA
jgi:hypothetical protein